jgi:hypothetical protein
MSAPLLLFLARLRGRRTILFRLLLPAFLFSTVCFAVAQSSPTPSPSLEQRVSDLEKRLNALDLRIPGEKEVTDTEYYSANQFIPEQMRLKEMSKENIKAELLVLKTVFSDNSIYSAQESK